MGRYNKPSGTSGQRSYGYRHNVTLHGILGPFVLSLRVDNIDVQNILYLPGVSSQLASLRMQLETGRNNWAGSLER